MNRLTMTAMKINQDGSKSFVEIDMNDVDFVENDGRRPVFHIGDEKFYMITNKTELEEWLSEHGFDMLDRSNLVNIKKIRHFDADYGKVFFTENPDKKSKYAIVARIKYEFVEHFLRRAIAKNKNTTLEYEPEKKRSIVSRFKEMLQD